MAYIHLQELADKLREAGVSKCKSKVTLLRWEKVGKIGFRRTPHNNYRVVSEADLEPIIRAFSVGGSGTWKPL